MNEPSRYFGIFEEFQDLTLTSRESDTITSVKLQQYKQTQHRHHHHPHQHINATLDVLYIVKNQDKKLDPVQDVKRPTAETDGAKLER